MIPGSTGLSTPRSARSSTRPVYSSASKKNWVTAKSASASLAARWSRSLDRSGRERMAGRVGRHPDREAADGPGQLDELDGVASSPGRRRAPGRVAAERHQVLDPGLAEATRISASSSRVWATQMRWAMGISVVVRSMPATRSKVRWRDSAPPR